jgi:putative transposase
MESGPRRVFRYPSTYEKTLSDGSFRRRMEPHIAPHLPAPEGHGRPRTHDLREILNAVFYVLKSGCQWRLLPHDFPRWPTVYWYFRKWRIEGTRDLEGQRVAPCFGDNP